MVQLYCKVENFSKYCLATSDEPLQATIRAYAACLRTLVNLPHDDSILQALHAPVERILYPAIELLAAEVLRSGRIYAQYSVASGSRWTPSGASCTRRANRPQTPFSGTVVQSRSVSSTPLVLKLLIRHCMARRWTLR